MSRTSRSKSDQGAGAPPAPMEAILVDRLPDPPGWQYEPKWDGFRAVIVRKNDDVSLWSKAGKPLGRYFPDILERIRAIPVSTFTLDGELVIPVGGHLSFEALQARLHPAASCVEKLARETPAQLILFDCLRVGDTDYRAQSLKSRREALSDFHAAIDDPAIILSPATSHLEEAEGWLAATGGALDGVMAKDLALEYRPGERTMYKVKQMRTADCVIGGYRKTATGAVASLLLGLYNADGKLDLVGYCSAFDAEIRASLRPVLRNFEGGIGFTGRAPGGPSRWSPGKSAAYFPLSHELVAEVIYDQVTAGRFRHGTRWLRWREDKAPLQCTADQLIRELRPAALFDLIGKKGGS